MSIIYHPNQTQQEQTSLAAQTREKNESIYESRAQLRVAPQKNETRDRFYQYRGH